MTTHALLMLAVGLWSAADAPNEQGVRRDVEKLQGTWELVSLEKGGRPVNGGTPYLRVEGERLSWASDPKGARPAGTGEAFRIDPTASPKAIDVDGQEVRATGRVLPVVVKGIYELDGDRLRLCLNRGATDPGRSTRARRRGTPSCTSTAARRGPPCRAVKYC